MALAVYFHPKGMTLDGRHQRLIVTDGAEDEYPARSSDGGRVVFSRSMVPCTAAVNVVSAGECSLTHVGGFEVFIMDARRLAPDAVDHDRVPKAAVR